MENAAVVASAFTLQNVTVPGPLTLDQVFVSAEGPSLSVAVPASAAVSGNVTVWSEPAFTAGGWFVGPVDSSMCRKGPLEVSNAFAVRWPVPVKMNAMALPLTHPARL